MQEAVISGCQKTQQGPTWMSCSSFLPAVTIISWCASCVQDTLSQQMQMMERMEPLQHCLNYLNGSKCAPHAKDSNWENARLSGGWRRRKIGENTRSSRIVRSAMPVEFAWMATRKYRDTLVRVAAIWLNVLMNYNGTPSVAFEAILCCGISSKSFNRSHGWPTRPSCGAFVLTLQTSVERLWQSNHSDLLLCLSV